MGWITTGLTSERDPRDIHVKGDRPAGKIVAHRIFYNFIPC